MSLIPGALTDPVLRSEVPIEGDAELTITAGTSVDRNSRMMLDGAFDIAEMSFSTYIKARELGKDLIGLPIFTGRGFLQPGLICSSASGIRKPEDIASKRVGLPQFWMTSSVWHRLILEQQHGVHQDAVKWFTAAEERFDEVPVPAGVSIQRLEEGLGVKEALGKNKVDAIMVPPRGVAESSDDSSRSPYENLSEAQRAYYAKTGVFPIMHFVVMRDSLRTEQPGLATAIGAAFDTAKKRAEQSGALPATTPGIPAGTDAWAFGLDKNQAALEAFLGFSRAQSWVAKTRTVQDFFVKA